MKYLYSIITLLIVSIGFSQETLQDFEGSNSNLGPFGGAAAVIDADPEIDGTRGNVLKATSVASGNVWQGFTFTPEAKNLQLTTDKTVTLDVYSTSAMEFALKVQDGLESAPVSVKNAAHTGSGWEQITIDFSSGNVDNTGAANGVYPVLAVFLNWNAASNGFGTAVDKTFYIDNITGVGVDPPAPTTVPPSAGANAAPARAASDVISLFSDSYTTATNLNFDQGWCGAGAVTTVTLDDGSQVVRYNGKDCQGMGFDAIDASSFTKVHFDLYIDNSVDPVGKVFNLKYVNGGGVEVVQTVALAADIAKGEWVSFDLDLPVEVASYTTLQQFAVVCNIQGEALWYDNLYFHKETTLSSSNVDVIGLKLYPNPAVDVVNIAAAESIDQVLVFDLMGRLVKEATPGSNDFRLDVSHLNKGVYMVQLKAGDKVATTKLIK